LPDERRGEPVELTIDGATVRGFTGETLAAALHAGGRRALGRSLKYHRPRGPFCFDGHCGGCLVRVDGVPNLRACQVPCTAGATLRSQNAYPSAESDVLGAFDFVFRRGMDHHGLLTGTRIGNKLANRVVRTLSGLGRLPDEPGRHAGEVALLAADVVVIGGGPAGLAAGIAARRAGVEVIVIDEQVRAGGSLRADPRGGVDEAEARRAELLVAGGRLLEAHTAIGVFGAQAGATVVAAGSDALVHLRARAWVWATGGYAVNLPFADNDRPGVLAARGVGRLLVDHAIVAGDKVALVVDRASAEVIAYADALAAALAVAGATVEVVDGATVEEVGGRKWVERLVVADRAIDCDVVAVAAIPSPATEGPRQHGCAVALSPAAGGFAVVADADGVTSVPGVLAAGDVCGHLGPARAAAAGARAGLRAAALAREAALAAEGAP
jgi:sarcosine oxidase subunit alpha